ncbi:MAG: acyl-CoA carboxylase subunit beta [Myxococcales bacterium]|nr:acyl-CoA carboxylase subunit beta [Myxococcales bacterium]MCB9708652.1 acyl-CoA carboxylase subunit beta [Myxococcales bacterium]
MTTDKFQKELHRIHEGGHAKYHAQNAARGKLFARDRIALLVDPESFIEDGAFANHREADLPADGVITGFGTIDGRTVALVANDSTVKAGSWGRLTVEKILRLQESVLKLRCPVLYLVDSAGARITDQVEMFPGRRGAGRIFYNQVMLSGVVPQVCVLFGPSAAGGAYIPAFCDIVVMVKGSASMYLGSPRMAEMVIGEKTTLEEMGGAKMHCSVSGCGDFLLDNERDAITTAKTYLDYFPDHCGKSPPAKDSRPPSRSPSTLIDLVPIDENKPFDMTRLIEGLVDQGSWLEVKALYAKEILTGFGRIEGQPVGIVANQPQHLGGVLFVDSANKAARFIGLCDAFNIPLLYLADVPGFMIGTKVERQGIIRAGAKMVSAVSEASVPSISVIVRKAYGAGLYAMAGPAFEPDACLALSTACIAVMGARAAVNAVYHNKIQGMGDAAERNAFIDAEQTRYRENVDLGILASELVVDDIVAIEGLREELARRFRLYARQDALNPKKKHSIMPM